MTVFGKGGKTRTVLLSSDVRDTPLPNIEEADQLIGAWTDRPLPAGLAPMPRQS